jgi:hypothetical protein
VRLGFDFFHSPDLFAVEDEVAEFMGAVEA